MKAATREGAEVLVPAFRATAAQARLPPEGFEHRMRANAEGRDLREISTIIGAEALTNRDRTYLANADAFEREFILQGEHEARTVEQTLDIGWRLFSALPEEDLKLIRQEFITKYHPSHRQTS